MPAIIPIEGWMQGRKDTLSFLWKKKLINLIEGMI